jgi:hypothetical protein
MLGVVVTLTAALCAQQPAGGEPPQHELPVSVARIRAGLERTQVLRLTLTDRKPDFRVDIRERRFEEDLLNRLDFRSGPVPPGGLYAFEQRQRIGPPGIAQPLVMVDVLAIGQALHSAIANARRSSAERAAREEVQRALAEFCATHDCLPPD